MIRTQLKLIKGANDVKKQHRDMVVGAYSQNAIKRLRVVRGDSIKIPKQLSIQIAPVVVQVAPVA